MDEPPRWLEERLIQSTEYLFGSAPSFFLYLACTAASRGGVGCMKESMELHRETTIAVLR